jgi:hypothetical protein
MISISIVTQKVRAFGDIGEQVTSSASGVGTAF